MRLRIALATLALGVALPGMASALEAAAPPPPAPLGARLAPGAIAPAPARGSVMPTPETAIARKAKSEDCYRQADAQNLHGKPRKHFHRTCMQEE